jgi:hypothetical protein
VVVGYTQQAFETESATAGSQAFITDQLEYNDLGSGSVYTQPESGSSAWALNSYLGRINYSIDQKYIFTVSGRADGSSRFGKDKKWGYFPSAAFAWNISREDFLSSYKTISNLKLRLSAGVTGNQEIGQYLRWRLWVPILTFSEDKLTLVLLQTALLILIWDGKLPLNMTAVSTFRFIKTASILYLMLIIKRRPTCC